MQYNLLILIAFGLGGILIHNLVKLDKINRKEGGKVNLWKYWNFERFTILLSIIVVSLGAAISDEIKQLHEAGKWMGLGFISLGYMAQSIVVTFMGRAEKRIKSDINNEK